MAVPRLPFLYPSFARALVRSCEPAAGSQHHPRTGFHTAAAHQQTAINKRRGTAVEPPPQFRTPRTRTPKNGSKSKATAAAQQAGEQAVSTEQDVRVGKDSTKSATQDENTPQQENSNDAQQPIQQEEQQEGQAAKTDDIVTSSLPEDPVVAQFKTPTNQPELQAVLQLDEDKPKEQNKPPNLHPPPYVHHFDTYTLVRDLGQGTFTEEQSITVMKAVRGLLAENLAIAQDALVSKSDVENETYLFRAACSELRTEIQNNRKAESHKMRTERTQLQHEVDIINQKLTQELASLKDDLKGVFDDRKMAVRMEQRGMDSAIQELNYKITVSLNSDMKSEVEGLRWVLTRRAASAIAIMAFLILSSLRYASYHAHKEEMAKKQAKEASGGSGREGSQSSGGTNQGQDDPNRRPPPPAETSEILSTTLQSPEVGYVSLG